MAVVIRESQVLSNEINQVNSTRTGMSDDDGKGCRIVWTLCELDFWWATLLAVALSAH